MAGFINTNHKVTIDSLVKGMQEKLKNPYYLFNDKKATIVDYYNQNTTRSTLDEGMVQPYDLLGSESPIRFNLIKDAYLYGIDRVAISQDIGEYGLEADPIEGEAIVLPNTFIPIANDYFKINYASSEMLFKVTSVSIDTLESGANAYRITYKYDRDSDDQIESQVVENYRMIVNNLGTNFKAVIRSTDYDMIEVLDTSLTTLKTYFKELFFSNKVQTFIFDHEGYRMYDPYMIEFLIKNKLLEGSGEYVYITHEVSLPKTFTISYNESLFRSIEMGDINKVSNRTSSAATKITDMNSLMSVRTDDYFMIDYSGLGSYEYITEFANFDPELPERIRDNRQYDKNSNYYPWNIVIAHFNGIPAYTNIIEYIDNINYSAYKDVFYLIPIMIFIVEGYIKTLLK